MNSFQRGMAAGIAIGIGSRALLSSQWLIAVVAAIVMIAIAIWDAMVSTRTNGN